MNDRYYKRISSDYRSVASQIKEIASYKDLIFIFVKRDFISRYKQTILGPAWAIIRPFLTTIVFTFIFGNVAGFADCGKVPSFLFFMCGNVFWSLFSDELKSTSGTFLNNIHIMTKVYFPRLVMPIATSFTQLLNFAIQMAMFLLFYVIFLFMPGYEYGANLYILMVPILLLQLLVLALGAGLIIASVTIKYRDLNLVIDFIIQLWMYGTPIAYSLSLFKNKWISTVIRLNPMTSIVEALRLAFLGSSTGSFSLFFYSVSWLITIAIFIVGVRCFNKVERTFADII